MAKQPNVLLFGAGSIGAVYLHQLRQAGCTITAVCRSNYSAVKDDGFRLQSKRFGDVRYKPDSLIRSTAECPPDCFYDYILVATKSLPGSKLSAMDMIRPAVGNHTETAIVLCQNGIGIEDEAAKAFPHNPILSGVIYLPATQTSQGIIHHPEMLDLLELGTFPANAPASHKTAAVRFADLMVKGGGDVKVYDDIQVARWSKLILNASWNPICALTLCTDGDFLLSSSPFAHDLVWGLMMEIVALARTIGIPGVDEKTAEEKLMIAQRRASSGTGREMSMLQDIRQGRLFEVEAIIGNAVRLGQKWGVEMPRLQTVYALAKGRYEGLLKETQI
ncbi:hypothetical protein N7508_001579 [Penicillium antarcticum]|uniref:uncharacterized protein n=1 Tax=Penicillium antarcticum TaxID=416450 RepID=UPI0023A338A8|nr:uncharacterized protein N7508_001579 [Penicillium antarcticum]KAJ5317071.1 hypothetical protein N7508_001579 [Penicillium antarcticum]